MRWAGGLTDWNAAACHGWPYSTNRSHWNHPWEEAGPSLASWDAGIRPRREGPKSLQGDGCPCRRSRDSCLSLLSPPFPVGVLHLLLVFPAIVVSLSYRRRVMGDVGATVVTVELRQAVARAVGLSPALLLSYLTLTLSAICISHSAAVAHMNVW